MKILSRSEELVLLAIWRLKDDAYCVPIHRQITNITDKKWSFGSLYITLNRLEQKRLIQSNMGQPTNERGGRAKRFYLLTDRGLAVLREIRELQQKMWLGIPDAI